MRRAAAVLVAALAVLATAGPAAAASVTGPVPSGGSVTAHGDLALAGVVDENDRTGVAELRITGPGYDRAVARAKRPTPEDPRADPSRVAFTTPTGRCALPESPVCAAGQALPNGRYAVRLFEVERLANEPERERGAGPEGQPAYSVLVDVPAGKPQDVRAAIEGRTVTVSWARAGGPDKALVEPDVVWTVVDGAGRSAEVTPDACGDGVCRTTFDYPADSSGARRYTVAASRPCSGCTNAPVASEPSGEVVVPVVPGAGPDPTPGGSGAPGTPGTGGTGRADPGTFARSFGGFGPKLGLPKLPPLPQQPPAVAAPEVADTFEDTLDYGDREEPGEEDPVAASRPGTTLTSTGGLLGNEDVVRGVAAAMVLALSGAHLRAWLARAREESADL